MCEFSFESNGTSQRKLTKTVPAAMKKGTRWFTHHVDCFTRDTLGLVRVIEAISSLHTVPITEAFLNTRKYVLIETKQQYVLF